MAQLKRKPASAKSKRGVATKPARVKAEAPRPAVPPLSLSSLVKSHISERRWREALSLLESDSVATAGSPRMMSYHAAALRSVLRDCRAGGQWGSGLELCRRTLELRLGSAASSVAIAEFVTSAALAQLAKQDAKATLDVLEPLVALNLGGEEAWAVLRRPIIKLAAPLGREELASEMGRFLALFHGREAQLFNSDVERASLKSLYTIFKGMARSGRLDEANELLGVAKKITWSADSTKTLATIVGTIARLAVAAREWKSAAGLLEGLETLSPGFVEYDSQLRRHLRADATRSGVGTAMLEAGSSTAYLALAKAGIWQAGVNPAQAAGENLLKEALSKSAEEIARLRSQVARLNGAGAKSDGAAASAALPRANGGNDAGLSEVQSFVLNELMAKGICRIAFNDFFGESGTGLWEGASAWMDEFSSCDALKLYMEAFSTARDSIVDDEKFRKNRPQKLFEFNRSDYGRPLALDEPCMRIGLRPEIIRIAEQYLGTAPKMRSAVSWVHVPMFPSLYPRSASQRWHRDQEDGRILKLFTLFSDVDIDTGPFEYIPESTPGGRYAGVWDFNYSTGGTGYPPEGRVEALVPPEDRYIAVAKRGTLVFVDTCGLHRGGYVTLKPRVATQTTYLRPSAPARILQNPLYKPSETEAQTLTQEQLFAIS